MPKEKRELNPADKWRKKMRKKELEKVCCVLLMRGDNSSHCVEQRDQEGEQGEDAGEDELGQDPGGDRQA